MVMSPSIVFFDTEISTDQKRLLDLGAVTESGAIFHGKNLYDFAAFIAQAKFLCGHNIVEFDLRYLEKAGLSIKAPVIDTLFLSAWLFPKRPYHRLVKDDKILSEDLNNPVNDSKKARTVFWESVQAFKALNPALKRIYHALLKDHIGYRGFFEFVGFSDFLSQQELCDLICREFQGQICEHAPLSLWICRDPVALAHVLAVIATQDRYSLAPSWVSHQYPNYGIIARSLRQTPCPQHCAYCRANLEAHRALKDFFGYTSFRTYEGEPLQESAAEAAMAGHSLLAVFPTGGGKSLTFQLPALVAARTTKALTVVISPLQSLMKDQVDHLSEAGIYDAYHLNGLLSPIERAQTFEAVADGRASILYISPEMLRSKFLMKTLSKRTIERFVIDEAHCFSTWGHDFRVDYLFIAEAIKTLQRQQGKELPIAVSCFTATAKPQVIEDIQEYFYEELGIGLWLFLATSERKNLRYQVLEVKNDEERYQRLRSVLSAHPVPTIVYVGTVAQTREVAERLKADGFSALPFNGKMNPEEKTKTQELFIDNKIDVIVATNAFGMGVDKPDVGLVVHYQIAPSLENYMQEAGRGARAPETEAFCVILFAPEDIDRLFGLLQSSHITIHEIKSLWRAIKELSKKRKQFSASPFELATQAGWTDSGLVDREALETKVRTALGALEIQGFIKRKMNASRVFATGIGVNNVEQGRAIIDRDKSFVDSTEKMNATRILSSLISRKNTKISKQFDGESKIDYLADTLGLDKQTVIDIVVKLRNAGILEDYQDMTAKVKTGAVSRLTHWLRLEEFLIRKIAEENDERVNVKVLNTAADELNIKSTVKGIRLILNYWAQVGLLDELYNCGSSWVHLACRDLTRLKTAFELKVVACEQILKYFDLLESKKESEEGTHTAFSYVKLCQALLHNQTLLLDQALSENDIKAALLYLAKTRLVDLEGGFFVLYNSMIIERLIDDTRKQFTKANYSRFNEHYLQKIQQIHVVNRFANLLSSDYETAMQFVRDYFGLEYQQFVKKYYPDGERGLNEPVSAAKKKKILGTLSEKQLQILEDRTARVIAVTAGPGSGKTRVLVHKLASLLTLEEVKAEQLLMLTFSRFAAIEFKQRLIDLIGSAAHYVDVKTFHSYAFDLLGRVGDLKSSDQAVAAAVKMIRFGQVEADKINKAVLVIDEAQDMQGSEYELMLALLEHNPELRIIAVGDDDQAIYEFRGADAKFFKAFSRLPEAKNYELSDNYRSRTLIVDLANHWAESIADRLKTQPTRAVSHKKGQVTLTRCLPSASLMSAVNAYLAEPKPKTAFLTRTNEEAYQLYALMLENGIRARLLEASSRVRLTDLAEIENIMERADEQTADTPLIVSKKWREIRQWFNDRYRESTRLNDCNAVLDTFESVSKGPDYYYSDLNDFLSELSLNDCVQDDQTVTVSTMHKAKGREFDNVYLTVSERSVRLDEAERRLLYVAMTRARQALRIFTDTDFFDAVAQACDVEYDLDENQYGAPRLVILPMQSHKDVYLGFFKGKEKTVSKMHAGQKIFLRNARYCAELDGHWEEALRVSRAFAKRIEQIAAKGYQLQSAKISAIVSWTSDEDQKIPIVLADFYFRKVAS